MELVETLIKKKGNLIGERRRIKLRIYDGMLRRMVAGPLDSALKGERGALALAEKIDASDYSASTKSDLKKYLKMIWKLANGYDLLDSPRELRTIKVAIKRKERKLPGQGQLISEDEIKRMLGVSNVRDRAALHLLYEAGLRPHELLSLKKSSIEFVKDGARVSIPEGTKTGARSILVIDCVPELAAWLTAHPVKSSDAYFITTEYRPGKYTPMLVESLNKMVKEAAKKAGIRRNVKTYLLRHTSATRLAKILTDAQMKAYYGWEQDSSMASTYIHLSGKDVDAPLLAAHGKKIEKEELEGKLLPRICARCGKQNAHDAQLCQYCGLPTDKEKAKLSDMALHEEMKTLKAEVKELRGLIKEEYRERIRKKEVGKTQ